MTTRTRLGLGLIVSASLAAGTVVFTAKSQRVEAAPGQTAQTPASQGQTATLLSDGRWLLVGGEGPKGTLGDAAVFNPSTGRTTMLAASLTVPRAWHTATVLSDGTVLIIGGRRGDALVEVPEVFDPGSGTFMPIAIAGAGARAAHTATLLTDGRVLVAGGATGSEASSTIEVWDPELRVATPLAGAIVARSGHEAALLDDGRVLLTGGRNADGSPAADAVVVDAQTAIVISIRVPDTTAHKVPHVAGSVPANGAADVKVDRRLALRFSDALNIDSLTSETITLTGPEGPRATRVIPAEQGRLAFIWPAAPLAEDTTYALGVSGAVDPFGVLVAPASITFTTETRRELSTDSGDTESWVPDASSMKRGWRTDRPPSPWESLAPLMAPPGVTAISGRVLALDGRPLPGVTLEIAGAGETESDRTGRFLLLAPSLAAGRHVLEIEGETASRPNRRYGFFEYGMSVVSSQTNILPFTIWMPRLDTAHTVRIPSPTTSEVVVTTPYIPGLELHLPPQTVIRGEDGKPVTEVGITAIPVDRPPFPLAKNVEVPVYFTIQPGGAYVYTGGAGPKGAQLLYPNYRQEYAGKRMQFFHYDPEVKDWYVYGLGTVTPNEAQVIPDPTTRIYEFTGAMINGGGNPGGPGRPPGDKCTDDGDPVNLVTGLFVLESTDLYLPDVMPLTLTRTYRSQDQEARSFGYGTIHPYAMFLSSAQQYVQADLILPDGGRVHYVRTSAGTSWTDAVFVHQEDLNAAPPTSATPTAFYKSVMRWNGNGWDVTLKDGTVYVFGENAPLQAIRDRYGNTITITHASGQSGPISQVTSPNGRWIRFTYDASNRITEAKDNIGRTVSYMYDGNGNLATMTDPENHVTSYTYDSSHRMLTVKPPNLQGTPTNLVTNEYTTTADAPTPVGWVKKQTHADGGIYQFAYTVLNGKSTQTDVTDPRGYVRRVTFNSDGYTLSDTRALGQPEQLVTSSVRQTGYSS